MYATTADPNKAHIRRVMHQQRMDDMRSHVRHGIESYIAESTKGGQRVPNYGGWWLGRQAHMMRPVNWKRRTVSDMRRRVEARRFMGGAAVGCEREGTCGSDRREALATEHQDTIRWNGVREQVSNVPEPGQVARASDVGSGDPLKALGPIQVPDYFSLSEDTWDCWTFGEPTSIITEWVGWPEIPLIQWESRLPGFSVPQYFRHVMEGACPPPRNIEVGCFTPNMEEYLDAQDHFNLDIANDDLRAVYTMASALILKNLDLLEWALCVALHMTWPMPMIWRPEQQNVGGFWGCMQDLILGDYIWVEGKQDDYTASTVPVPEDEFSPPDPDTGFPRPPKVRIGELSSQAEDAIRDWKSGNADIRLCAVYRVAILLGAAELPHICGLDWPRPHAHCMAIFVVQSAFAWALKQRYPCIAASPCCRIQDEDIINPGSKRFWKC